MRVLVVVALPHAQDVVEVQLPDGATVADALAAARVAERHPGLSLERVGIWGKPCAPGAVLREADRVEVYRPLRADAKRQRRVRAQLNPSRRSRSGP
jgi:putative ubiquitin-RnfH superfamily antitoxin RatB of RatAB toxin-antitoxin module